MTNSTNYPAYPRLWCALLIIGVCLVDCESLASYAEGELKSRTDIMREAKYIVVGQVVHVSFVFEQGDSGPISLVTVRVDKDIKNEIERADTLKTEAGKAERNPPPKTVTFFQIGGPYRLFDFLPIPSGDWVTAVGVDNVKRGESVFLMLLPLTSPIEHKGRTADSYPEGHGSIYRVRAEGKPVDDHIIERGWWAMDVTVLQMTRLVRATLKQPKRMRALADRVSKLKRMPFAYDAKGRVRPKQPDDRLPIVMAEVRAIERELNLPSLNK